MRNPIVRRYACLPCGSCQLPSKRTPWPTMARWLCVLREGPRLPPKPKPRPQLSAGAMRLYSGRARGGRNTCLQIHQCNVRSWHEHIGLTYVVPPNSIPCASMSAQGCLGRTLARPLFAARAQTTRARSLCFHSLGLGQCLQGLAPKHPTPNPLDASNKRHLPPICSAWCGDRRRNRHMMAGRKTNATELRNKKRCSLRPTDLALALSTQSGGL